MTKKSKATKTGKSNGEMRRQSTIRTVLEYLTKMDQERSRKLIQLRLRMNSRRPKVLTHEEADFVIKTCYDAGIYLKQEIKNLLHFTYS